MIAAAERKRKCGTLEFSRAAPGAADILRRLEAGASETMIARYFEDFAVGQVFKPTGRVSASKEDIIAFAQKFDPQPFHIDEEAGRNSIFGRLVGSGWHTAALTMSLIARSEYRPVSGTIGLGFEDLRWPLPLVPGDELRIESEVLEVRPSRSRPDWGLLKMRTLTFNQNGDIVQEIVANVMVPRRPTGS
jgi:acyl dehydratase